MTVQAVYKERSKHFYIGTSADTKPTASTIPPGSMFWENDTDRFYRSSDAGWVETQGSFKRIAGENNEDSTNGTDYLTAIPHCHTSDAIDLSNNASTTVWDGPCIVTGIWVEVTIGTAAATLDNGSTAKLTVPIALPIGEHPIPGLIFDTSLVVNPADTSTGTIRVFFHPLDPRVSWAA